MKFVIQILLVIVICVGKLSAQTSASSNSNPNDPVNRADTLLSEGKYSESITLARNAIFTKTKEKDYSSVVKAYSIICQNYIMKEEYEKAVKLSDSVIAIAKKHNVSQTMASLYGDKGIALVYLGNYDEAMTSLQSSLEHNRKNNNLDGISTTLNSIGKIYEFWHRYDDAIKVYKEALEIDRKLNKQNKVATRLSGIASAYRLKGDLDQALKYQKEALSIENKLDNKYKVAVRLDQLGEIYQAKEEFEKAELFYSESLAQLDLADKDMPTESKHTVSRCIILNHLGKINDILNKPAQALKYLYESYEIATKVKYHMYMMKNAQELSDVYAKQGNHKLAYDFYKRYSNIKDSTFNANSQKTIAEFREKYETEKKENSIALLTKDNELTNYKLSQLSQQRILYISLLIILALIAGLLYMKFYYKKITNRELESKNLELEEINRQKNRFFSIISHDLRSPISSFQMITNSLNAYFEKFDKDTLQSMIKEMNETAIQLNVFLKNLLEWAMTQTGKTVPNKSVFQLNSICPTILEMIDKDAARTNLKIEKDLDCDAKVFADEQMITTATRNIISNAIKFADPESVLKIKIAEDNDNWKLSVSNQGPGMTPEEVQMLFRLDVNPIKIGSHHAKGSGMGLIISNELMKLNGGLIQVDSASPENTTFSIVVPKFKETPNE